MKIGAVIAEFNPIHAGHKILIDTIKRENDAVITVMSGNFVQRGECAIFEKSERAKSAIKCGVDLVLQGHDHVYMRTGSLVNNATNPYDTAYLHHGDSIYKTQVQPTGTTYVISGTCGVKTYIQNDVTLTDKSFPRGEKILSVDLIFNLSLTV